MRAGCCLRRGDLGAAAAAGCGREARSCVASPFASLRRPCPAAGRTAKGGKAGDHLASGTSCPAASYLHSVRKPGRGGWPGNACGDAAPETLEPEVQPVARTVTRTFTARHVTSQITITDH